MAGRYQNGLTTLFGKMEPNQALFVHHLRTNPNGVNQVEGSLWEDDQNMCALGLGLEAFGMIARYREELAKPVNYAWDAKPAWDAYAHIAAVLNMPKHHVEQVYELNDDHSQTFGQIADVLEEYFAQGDLFAWDKKGPRELWEDKRRAETEKTRKAFEDNWATYQAKYEALLAAAAAAFGCSAGDLRADSVFESYSGRDFFDDVINNDYDF